jgi:hypothetical protein
MVPMSAARLPFWRREFLITRTSAHVIFAAVLWPSLTAVGAALTILNLPYFSVSLPQAFAASIAGTFMTAPDMLVTGTMFFGLSYTMFQRFGAEPRGRHLDTIGLLLEPLLTFVAVAAGVSLWYPAVLSQPILFPLGTFAAGLVVAMLLASVVLGAVFAGRRGKRARLAIVLIVGGMLSPAPLTARSAIELFLGDRPDIVILGIDSVSYGDTDATFREWVRQRGGSWYEQAVTPGLLTNSVWASILTMQPVREHGVFHTFQPLPSASPALVSLARDKGYHTVSVFTDQFTCAVGSRAGFDDDRGGPVGWRQLLLAIVADNSLLVPIVKPVLPRFWPSLSPPNHAGTFTYDLRRDVRRILRAANGKQPTMVTAHINYLHHAAYPSSRDLSWSELARIATAPAGVIRDRSFNWQDRDEPSDPVRLRAWKLKYVHEVIASEVDTAQYLGNGRRFVLFSDHGDRVGLTVENFSEKSYYHVPLVTFGVSPRCTRAPISLIDVGSLLGFAHVRAVPSVEFTIAPQEQWSTLVKTASLRWSGAVDLDRELLADVYRGLRRYDPPQDELGPCVFREHAGSITTAGGVPASDDRPEISR